MRILIVQMLAASLPRVRPRFDQNLAVLAAGLRQDGHQLQLAAFSRYLSGELHEVICRFRPGAIYLQADRYAADITRHAVEFVGRHHVLPVIVGGMYTTAQPDAALSVPGVLAVAFGEPEVSARRFLWALERGEDYEQTPGVWINPPDGPPVKNGPAPLTAQLDSLPFADRELFEDAGHIARTHAAPVAATRGCLRHCAYCLNDWLADIYLGHGPWVRRRSPQNVCDEIDQLAERFDQLARIHFVDHPFALDRDWLGRFAALYAERCSLPFSCHLLINAVDARQIRALKQAGCDHVVCELVSGSAFIRNEIFEMDTSDRQIEHAFRLLRSAGLRTSVVHWLGSPYETAITVEHTLELLDRIGADEVISRLFAPLPGTRAEEICRESGWLAGVAERGFRENAPMLDMPAMPARTLLAVLDKLTWKIRHRRFSGLMRWLARIPAGRGRTLYDRFARRPAAASPPAHADLPPGEVIESDGAMRP